MSLSDTHSILKLRTKGLNTKFYLTYGVRKYKRSKQNIYTMCMPRNCVSGWEFEDTKVSHTISPHGNAKDVVVRLRIAPSHAQLPSKCNTKQKIYIFGMYIQKITFISLKHLITHCYFSSDSMGYFT